jgi:hypothetical protein
MQYKIIISLREEIINMYFCAEKAFKYILFMISGQRFLQKKERRIAVPFG